MARQRIAILAPFAAGNFARGSSGMTQGGVERYVGKLSEQLARAGRDITVVSPAHEWGQHSGNGFQIVTFPRLGVCYGAPVFNPLHMLRALRQFDLVHAQASYPLLSELNVLSTRLRRIPSVVTYHFDPAPPSPTGKVWTELYMRTLARLVKRHDRIILSSASYWMNSRLLRGTMKDRVRIVPMGADTDYFVPSTTARTADRFLFVGRLVPYKAIPLLLEAMETVNRSLPEHELWIIGSGPLEAELRADAARRKAKVRFLGKVSDEQLLEAYQTSAATVLASHSPQEAFGMTLVESMSCGTPVIATDIPGVREVAAVGGTVVRPGSAEALARAMMETASSARTIAARQGLHDTIEAKFSWRSVAERTAAVYDELLH